ncbi:DUF309 domain-containing protein [Deinococcus peraridilitoris]|uniref:DUF309 domain-containing protein n=1 Tax=Deinococcus peraridilitoris (strain DSM 19664 / LMG 22246 / CIP 109416 / KR-200) TaxID=937777 RepID=L0A3P1_DEIPD|nr:DUF309 domain-containing protein [Deinococcus peraridilitoris]AFZ68518.1 hypothetical protein Deipe_3069 [Deinococcus peraridilitoris DSM 19664]
MRTELREGARLFNEGRYWEAHEAWEAFWRTATGNERIYVQSLILLAAALHKRWVHGRLTRRNYEKALRYLSALPDEFDGVRLQVLAREVEEALEDCRVRPRLPLLPEHGDS